MIPPLDIVSDYSIYDPQLPAVITAHPKFGDGRQFFVDGFLDEVVLYNNRPVFTITDNFGREVFKVNINPDPRVQSITCTSALNSVRQSNIISGIVHSDGIFLLEHTKN